MHICICQVWATVFDLPLRLYAIQKCLLYSSFMCSKDCSSELTNCGTFLVTLFDLFVFIVTQHNRIKRLNRCVLAKGEYLEGN